jgi:antirestriction protein ArdC
VAFHELTHWSGHKSRIDRDLKNRFGSRNYPAEELIAELGAAFCVRSPALTVTSGMPAISATGSSFRRPTNGHSLQRAATLPRLRITFAAWPLPSRRKGRREDVRGDFQPQT